MAETRRKTNEGLFAYLALLALLVGILVSLLRAQAPSSDETRARSPQALSSPWVRRSLSPVPNLDPNAVAQLVRARPYRVVASSSGAKVYVTLTGKESGPGSAVVVVDAIERKEHTRIKVGSSPYGLALHPRGRWLVVTNRFSNFLSVIDTTSDRVAAEIAVPFYCEDLAFQPDGERLFISNFWKDQVLVVDLQFNGDQPTGSLRELGFNRKEFFGATQQHTENWSVCDACGWRNTESNECRRCRSKELRQEHSESEHRSTAGVRTILRARCGSSACHLYPAGGFVAGPDREESLQSAIVHSFAGNPDLSPLLRTTVSVRQHGLADAVDGRHHPGGVVFDEPDTDPDFQRLRQWIASGVEGPGIAVGEKPRDLVVSPDGKTLYVANTGSLDVSVVDLVTLRETRRIFTRSPVNDLVWVDDKLILATLGVGSGHPKAHHAGHETTDPNHPEAEFTLFRDLDTGKPLPLTQQMPLGPYDEVDGTAQEKFRDISNDVVIVDPAAEDVAAYAATESFTRYTSDSFESLPGDIKGDVPPELMKVAGAFPEQIARKGKRIYVTMSGTFEVQEWLVEPTAAPAKRLVPGRVFATGFKPTGIAVVGEALVIADHLGDSLTFVDLGNAERTTVMLEPKAPRFPANDFERGEFFVQTSVFSVDQDQSCVHCHYRDTSDGQRWSVSQVMGQSRDGAERTGGSREVPDIRNLFHEVPFFVEGTLSMDEALTMMMEHNPLIDFQGVTPAGDFNGIVATPEEGEIVSESADTIIVATGKRLAQSGARLVDLVKRRERFFSQTSETFFGKASGFRDLQRFIGNYQGGEPRLLPNPVQQDDPMVLRGRAIFESPKVGCSGCHPAPGFTDKVNVHNANRAFAPLVTPGNRDNVHTLVSADRLDTINGFVRYWDREDKGRVESHEGFFVAPSLRGLWARPARLLHHGHAVSLREVLCTPEHPALRPRKLGRRDPDRPGNKEIGLNELEGLIDTHGTTSHLSILDIECLRKYVTSID